MQAPELSYAGLWTHLAVADEPADPFTGRAAGALRGTPREPAAPGCRRRPGCTPPTRPGTIAHAVARATTSCAAGSPSTGTCPPAAVGPGRADRGGRPRGRCAPRCLGRPRSATCASSAAGERTSYGRAYSWPERADVATVPVGYADGVPTSALRRRAASVLIGGRRRRVAGTVTMDQLLVDCGPDSGVRAATRSC